MRNSDRNYKRGKIGDRFRNRKIENQNVVKRNSDTYY